ncbi:MAG: DUF3579 domain-containing protein [Legionellaceae bacterium]|nr:DUF3579 domain-containing protein [Legionellaceae bacterium]
MSKKKSENNEKIIIEGVTQQGKTFRPADWAERVSGSMATFQNRRIQYSPLLQPSTNIEGYKCIILDKRLKTQNPEMYESILKFAKENHLKICGEDNE